MRFLIQKARFTVPLVVLTGVLLATPVIVSAQSTAGGASLQIPPGARAEGMGRFFTAVADDAFTPWWNPAGLGFNKGFNAALMHSQLVPGLADDVYFEKRAITRINQFVKLGYGNLPICIAKTQASISDSPKALGAPKDWTLTVTDATLSAGAGFLVVICGNMMLMPGLPAVPAAVNVDVNEEGQIEGLF